MLWGVFMFSFQIKKEHFLEIQDFWFPGVLFKTFVIFFLMSYKFTLTYFWVLYKSFYITDAQS